MKYELYVEIEGINLFIIGNFYKAEYENGLPEVGSTQPTISTAWGQVPASQSLIYAFDTNEANRAVQDAGFDGLTDVNEAVKYTDFAAFPDPAADNYRFYLETSPLFPFVHRYP